MTAPDNSLRARVVRLYAQGQTGREIAELLGLDHTTVLRWVRAELETRRTGPRGRVDVTDDQVIEMRDDLDMSWREAARSVGMSSSGLRKRYATARGQRRPWMAVG